MDASLWCLHNLRVMDRMILDNELHDLLLYMALEPFPTHRNKLNKSELDV